MKFSNEVDFEEGSFDINLTPLIDIVFLLLIFFMVSTTFVESRGLNVDLPSASAKPLLKEPKTITITVNDKGDAFIGSKEVSLEKLKSTFASYKDSAKQVTVVIRADKRVAHGKVVRIMDLAAVQGLTKLAIATTSESSN